jgi:serine/threonine-protein kinase
MRQTSPVPDLPEIGSRIAGYLVEGILGRGGMGVVYRARHEVLEREAAVKVLLAELGRDPDFRTRFLRESRMAARLSRHPNVLPVYDAGDADGLLYLAMYLVEGPSLAEVISQEGRLDAPRAVEIVRQVAAALDVAHAQDLVHRDVKPANILLELRPDGADHCFLGDFGLLKEARSTTGITSASVMVGTLDYMAPEQLDPRILGDEPVDGRVDVYALGCVLYECLAGARPFSDVDSDTALIVAHLSREPPRLSDVRPDLPPAIDGVIAGAMAKDRAERPATAGELAATAARVLSGVEEGGVTPQAAAAGSGPPPPTVAAPPPAPRPPRDPPGALPAVPPPPPPPARRSRLALLVGVPLLVLAVIVGVVLATSGGGGGGGPSDGPSPTAAGPTASATEPPIAREASVWVTGGTTLTRFDPETEKVIARIPVGTSPVAVAVDASSVWVVNSGDGTVSRIDPTTNEVVATIDVGAEPAAIASDGTAVWVAVREENTVARIDPATNEVVARVRVGENPQGIALDAGGVWVACFDQHNVARIDPATNEVVARVRVGENPTTAVLGEGFIWVPEQFDSTLAKIDPATNEVVASVGAGPEPIDVAVDAPYLWVVDQVDQHRIFRIEIETGRVQAVGGFGDALHITSGAGLIWVADGDHDNVVGLNPNDGSVLKHLRPRDEPSGVTVG